MMYGIDRAFEQERTKGKKEGKLETAEKMLKKNMALEDIIDITGLTLKEIKKIQTKLAASHD